MERVRAKISPEEYQEFRECSLKSWATFMLSEHGTMPDPDTLLKTLLQDAQSARLFSAGVANRRFIVTMAYPIYEFKGFSYDASGGLVNHPLYPVPKELTHQEAALFEPLIAHAPHTLTLEYLLKELGYDPKLNLQGDQEGKVHILVSRIRRKLGDYEIGNLSRKPRDPHKIHFLLRGRWGIGYAFDPMDGHEQLMGGKQNAA